MLVLFLTFHTYYITFTHFRRICQHTESTYCFSIETPVSVGNMMW